MKIYKFGGTSVGKPERMRQVKELITRDDKQKIVVLSAVSGTTNSLVEIGETLYAEDKAKASSLIEALYVKYEQFIKDLYDVEAFYAKGKEVIIKQFDVIRGLIEKPFTSIEERLLLAQGELISTQLFTHFLGQVGVEAELLWALDFMSVDEYHEPELEKISKKLTATLENTKKVQIYITQGYICMNPANEVDNLKRGGSDYTASLLGSAIGADEVQIWTDIDGMHNNDPRVVDKTAPIANLTFDEAAELAYFGAKILHPATIIPAQKTNTPVKLLNTMDPDAAGTTISGKILELGKIKAVAAKDGITAIKIKSSRMLLAYGFLTKVFSIFENYRTPIDMITTSEIAVSVTIDDNTNLDKIVAELEAFATIEVDTDQTIVCVAGQGIAEVKGPGMQILNSLKEIPIRMVSYGGSKNNISVLIASDYKKEALKRLNAGLFNF
ncbi:MAG: aspartate kinase [Cytophagales bacterium]|nr:aspartate kinase [Cytophagales bacterium]